MQEAACADVGCMQGSRICVLATLTGVEQLSTNVPAGAGRLRRNAPFPALSPGRATPLGGPQHRLPRAAA
jgi:hypothetical protein